MAAPSPSRFLGGLNTPPPPPYRSAMPTFETLDTDLIVTIAALVCALICVLALAFVARCAWLRRFVGRDSAAPPPPANQGLKKKVLKSLPKSTYGESREHAARLSDCAICLAEFAAGEEIRVLPQCGHGFHVACIDMWLGCHSSCPSCRRILQDARCQRCGSLPAAACSAAGARPETTDNHGNLFLP